MIHHVIQMQKVFFIYLIKMQQLAPSLHLSLFHSDIHQIMECIIKVHYKWLFILCRDDMNITSINVLGLVVHYSSVAKKKGKKNFMIFRQKCNTFQDMIFLQPSPATRKYDMLFLLYFLNGEWHCMSLIEDFLP